MTNMFEGFTAREMTYLGRTRTVHTAGAGPAVIVLHEAPRIEASLVRFARFVRDSGFSVFMPQLFGTPKPTSAFELDVIGIVAKWCVSREFNLLASNKTSPIVDWLRALAADIGPKCPGRGVGAVGMCFTGNFAISMLVEPLVTAAVSCQPGLPLRPSGLGVSAEDLAIVRHRLEREDFCVKAYRFEGDRLCPAVRFEKFREALGPRFEAKTLPDSAANPDERLAPHSVVTRHLIDRAGEPTRQALDEILAYLHHRLDSGS